MNGRASRGSPDVDLLTRVRELADDAEITLEWTGAMWVAEDQFSGERAVGVSVAQAWSTLRPRLSSQEIAEWLLEEA